MTYVPGDSVDYGARIDEIIARIQLIFMPDRLLKL